MQPFWGHTDTVLRPGLRYFLVVLHLLGPDADVRLALQLLLCGSSFAVVLELLRPHVPPGRCVRTPIPKVSTHRGPSDIDPWPET